MMTRCCNMPRLMWSAVATCGLVGAAVFPVGCDRPRAPAPGPATPIAPQPPIQPAAGAPTPSPPTAGALFAPAAITYFQDHCASCHGPYARFAGPQYSRSLSDTALVRKIEEMAAGPGRSPLDAAGLAAQTAYHRSLVQGTPYVSITARENDGLRGEVTPGATVVVVVGGDSHSAIVEAHRWSVHGVTKIERLIAIAANGARRTEIDVSQQAYSHANP